MALPRSIGMRVANGKWTQMPTVGFGTWAAEDPSWCTDAIKTALQIGVRHIDSAWEYNVDEQLGDGIRASGVPRDQIFVTSKFWPNYARPENVSKCLDAVLERSGLAYVDLFLAHFPGALRPAGDLRRSRNFVGATHEDQGCERAASGDYIPDVTHCSQAVAKLNGGVGSFTSTWQAMQDLVRSGKCRAVGVSNFEQEHIEEILPFADHGDVPLSCNQIEANPWYPNTELIAFLQANSIVPVIYSPFAPRSFSLDTTGQLLELPFAPNGTPLLKEPVLQEIAKDTGMDVGQVIQSWLVQRGAVPIGKSQHESRIRTNFAIRRLSREHHRRIDELKMEGRLGKSTNLNVLFPGLRMH